MRITLFGFLAFAIALSARAERNWYAGDFTAYAPRELPARFHEALDLNLDWRVLYGPAQEGYFSGLDAFLHEEKFNDPRRFTPLLGSAWTPEPDRPQTVICLGVDPRAPVPSGSLGDLMVWADAHSGMLIFADSLTALTHAMPAGISSQLFLGLTPAGWHPASAPGGQWDSLLSAGHRVTLIGSGSAPDMPPNKTCVWAESAHPHHLLGALRRGAAYVAEAGGLHLDFRLNDRAPGESVTPDDTAWIRLRAAARHHISRVALVADGEIVWSAEPNASLWETRLQLSLLDTRYVRAMAQSKDGGYRTLTNPIYVTPSFDIEPPNGAIDPLDHLAPLHLSLDSALESLDALSEAARLDILSAYLRELRTRYATVLVLEQRDDIIPDASLLTLAQSPDPAVRQGALFAQVVRDVPDLNEKLFQHLGDPDPAVRRYAARMLAQFVAERDNMRLFERLRSATPAERAYLIQALEPASTTSPLTQWLIHETRRTEFGLAPAATNALIAMGNRNFRVIRALLDSARAGHVTAVDILGEIGDHRVSEDLEKIFLKARSGGLRRAAFLALQKLGAGVYPNRPSIDGMALSHPPMLDGVLMPGEWINAATITRLVSDDTGDAPRTDCAVWTTRDSTHLLLAFTFTAADSTAPLPMAEWAISPSPALGVPFTFAIAPPVDSPLISDPLLRAAHTVVNNVWTTECAVPLAALGVDPRGAMRYLRMNIAFSFSDRRWAWTPTFGEPNNPDRYGDLHLNSAP